MGKAVIVAFLSILFYLTNLLGGGQQQLPPVNEPAVQHSYRVLGQQAIVLPERAVLRHAPDSQGGNCGNDHAKRGCADPR